MLSSYYSLGNTSKSIIVSSRGSTYLVAGHKIVSNKRAVEDSSEYISEDIKKRKKLAYVSSDDLYEKKRLITQQQAETTE